MTCGDGLGQYIDLELASVYYGQQVAAQEVASEEDIWEDREYIPGRGRPYYGRKLAMVWSEDTFVPRYLLETVESDTDWEGRWSNVFDSVDGNEYYILWGHPCLLPPVNPNEREPMPHFYRGQLYLTANEDMRQMRRDDVDVHFLELPGYIRIRATTLQHYGQPISRREFESLVDQEIMMELIENGTIVGYEYYRMDGFPARLANRPSFAILEQDYEGELYSLDRKDFVRKNKIILDTQGTLISKKEFDDLLDKWSKTSYVCHYEDDGGDICRKAYGEGFPFKGIGESWDDYAKWSPVLRSSITYFIAEEKFTEELIRRKERAVLQREMDSLRKIIDARPQQVSPRKFLIPELMKRLAKNPVQLIRRNRSQPDLDEHDETTKNHPSADELQPTFATEEVVWEAARMTVERMIAGIAEIKESVADLAAVQGESIALPPGETTAEPETSLSRRQTKRGLSTVEVEVLRYIARGMTNKEIGVKMSITDGRVEQHVGRIFDKLGASRRTEAAVIAVKEELINVEY